MRILFSQSLTLADAQPQLAVFKHMLATPVSTLACLCQSGVDRKSKDFIQQQKIAKSCYKKITQLFTEIGEQDCTGKKNEQIKSIFAAIPSYFGEKAKGITVLYESDGAQKAKVCVNRFMLEEALICLITNAIEAHDTLHPLVVISVISREKKLYIHIRDFGSGFSWRAKVSQQIFAISTKHSGTALGILFAQKIFTSAGGKITFKKLPTIGSEVMCELPLVH